MFETRFLVTTSAARVEQLRNEGCVFMVDGTVPGWTPLGGDYHVDHHRKGGPKTQISDISFDAPIPMPGDLVVTTQVDADACVAAAFLLLKHLRMDAQLQDNLMAIAHDCDHLHVPPSASYGHYAEYAAKAVADLKQQGFKIADELDLPKDRRTWTGEQKEAYASLGFQRGTEWLVEAALGKRDWPGTSPDAQKYWEGVEADTQMLIDEGRVWLSESGKSVIYSTKGVDRYIDPRCSLKAIAALGLEPELPIVLAVRDFQDRQGKGLTGDSYTPGSNPMHPLADKLDYSASGAWLMLNQEEASKRGLDASEVEAHWDSSQEKALPSFEDHFGFSPWGGRDKVGGSGWNSPSALASNHVCMVLKHCVEAAING